MGARRPSFRFGRRIGMWLRRRVAAGGGGGDVVGPQPIGNPTIASDGMSIVIEYDETLATVPAFGVATVSGTPALSKTSTGAGTTTWTIGFDTPILGSETVIITTTAGPTDAAANEADDLTAVACVNNSDIELETAMLRVNTDGSIADDGSYAPHRDSLYIVWGQQGGGDGGTVEGAGGAGPQLSIKALTDTPTGGFSWVMGNSSNGGANGTATAGADSTVTNSSGVIVRAKGGAAGVGGAVGAGGVGSTSGGVGDTVRAGGNGTDVSGVNTGGAASGVTSAASGINPGAPEGYRVLSNDAGGTSAGPNSTGNAGRSGRALIMYQRPVDTTVRPYVIGIRWGRDTANATARNVTWPDGSQAIDTGSPASGDVYVCGAAQDGSDTSAAISGFTKKAGDGAANAVAYIFAKDYAGGEAVSLTSANEEINWVTYLVRGSLGAASITGRADAVTADDPDPTSHDHGAAVNALWLNLLAADQGASLSFLVDAFPSGYDLQQFALAYSTGTNGVNLACAMQYLSGTQVHNPSAWTTSGQNANGGIATACIPKA